MSYCNLVSKAVNMTNLNSKSTSHDIVSPLTITTDMLSLSLSEVDNNSHCDAFNNIVGKLPDCGFNSSDIILSRMKSVDSAVCSLFTPSSSLQLSPSSQVDPNNAIYDSTSSSNTNNDSTCVAAVSQSKSRFILDYNSIANFSTNNLSQHQSPSIKFERNTLDDSVRLMCPSPNCRDYNAEYCQHDNSLHLQPNFTMDKSCSNSDNVLSWQNHSFGYNSNDKDDQINLDNNWNYEESCSLSNLNGVECVNQLFNNGSGKRPITGCHTSTPQHNFLYNQYIRPQSVSWNCYGTSTNNVCLNNTKITNVNQQQLPQSTNNPWNQALVNQKLGLAPAPVNAMNLSIYPNKVSSINGKRQLISARNIDHSAKNIANVSSSINNNSINITPNSANCTNNSQLKSQINGHLISESNNNFECQSSNQNTTPGDRFVYNYLPNGNNNFNYPDTISTNENMKINLDKELFDVLRLSIDDPDNYTNNVFKNINPILFPSILQREERFSRKVFVGGLPPDIDEEEITAAFKRFGTLVVDWPHKAESKSYFPPKGYCFLLFQEELSVQNLFESCIMDEHKYYWCVSSPTIKDKPVQIRPWSLADSDFVMDGSEPLDPRKTIFVGGVPRPLRAVELAMIMDRLYGGVCYSGIDTDPELKYPKGAGRVAFSNQQSYIAAISARFVQLQHHEIDKRVEVKPYVLDDQMCDECQGSRCGGKFAPFFCANVACLQYYCEQCWAQIHSRQGREYHKPLVKEGADRPRTVPFRW